MLLGLDTNSFRLATGLYDFHPAHPLALPAILERAFALGLAGVQIANPSLLASTDEQYLRDLRAAAERRNLYLELGIQGTQARKLGEAIEIAAKLGSRLVRTYVGPGRDRGWAAWRQQLDRAVDGLKQVAPLAAEKGVAVALENHGDLTSRELAGILDKVGNRAVGVCLDTGRAILVMEDPYAAAQSLLPYVLTACLTDFRLVASPRGALAVGCALGEGAVDLPGILLALRGRFPDLHVNIESPVMRWELPFLEDRYWDFFYDRTPRDLAAILRLLRRNALDPAADYRTPVERGEPEAAVLRYEEEMLERSVRYAKQVLLTS